MVMCCACGCMHAGCCVCVSTYTMYMYIFISYESGKYIVIKYILYDAKELQVSLTNVCIPGLRQLGLP